jgi:hypothetical protein
LLTLSARKIWPKTANLFTKSRAADRAAKLLTRDEAQRIVANIARPPGLLRKNKKHPPAALLRDVKSCSEIFWYRFSFSSSWHCWPLPFCCCWARGSPVSG